MQLGTTFARLRTLQTAHSHSSLPPEISTLQLGQQNEIDLPQRHSKGLLAFFTTRQNTNIPLSHSESIGETKMETLVVLRLSGADPQVKAWLHWHRPGKWRLSETCLLVKKILPTPKVRRRDNKTSSNSMALVCFRCHPMFRWTVDDGGGPSSPLEIWVNREASQRAGLERLWMSLKVTLNPNPPSPWQ